MGDAIFHELLTQTATIARPRVELDDDGAPKTPAYEAIEDGVAVRVGRSRTASDDDLLGRDEDVTRVAYLEPTDLRPSDRLTIRTAEASLTADAQVGETALGVSSTNGFLEGACVAIGGNGAAEEQIVVSADGQTLVVAHGLASEHEAGEPVGVVRRFEVISVEDEAGAGHHLRAVVREM